MNSKIPSGFRRFDLSDRSAVITGGAGLLGFQHAAAIAEASGKVILWDIHDEALSSTREVLLANFPDASVLCQRVDVSEEPDVENALSLLMDKGIVPNILINNASINPNPEELDLTESLGRFENYSLDSWNREVAVGLTGAFLCSKHVGTQMALRGNGVILNIASDLSVIGPDQRLYRKDGSEGPSPVKPFSYSVIKTGLIGLTRYLATYWADSGVRVNALSPGGVFHNHSNEFVRKIGQLIPIGRMAHQDEYRGAIQFLCSDASTYLTGQNIVMDGGRSVW